MRKTTFYHPKKVLGNWVTPIMSLLFLLISHTGLAQGYVTLGTQGSQSGNTTTNPANGYYESRRIQIVYSAAELLTAGAAAGNIERLAWDVSVAYAGAGGLPNYTIQMGHITTADIPTTTFVTGLTTVKNAYSYVPATGFNDITFDTPFNWNGTDNIIVNICFNSAPYLGFSSSFHGQVWNYTGVANNYRARQADGSDMCTATTSDQSQAAKPRVRFYMQQQSCLAPSALVSSAVMSDTATVTWTASASVPASGYEYYYSDTNTAPTAGTTPSGNVASGVSVNLSSLSPNTTYYVWVRSNCGGGDLSLWSSPVTFKTLCLPAALSYVTGFNAATIPDCWSRQLASATQTATKISFVETASNKTASPQEGSHFVRYNSYSNTSGGAGAEERLISPPLTSTGVSSVDVVFYWFQNNGPDYALGAYLNEGVTVQWSVDGGTTWTSETYFPRQVASAPAAGEWSKKTVTLPAGAANQANLLVALKFRSEYGYNMYVDNFTVRETPDCVPPTALLSANVGENSAGISWTASASLPANGYEYYYSDTNTAPTGATTASGSVAAGVVTANITGLTAATDYYVWVRSYCDTGLYSEWAGPISFTTLCDAPDLLSTTPNTLCGQGTTTLEATVSPGGTLKWYAAATGGASIGTGETFTTPFIDETTTYYVAAEVEGTMIAGGKLAPEPTWDGFVTTNWGIVFNALTNITVNSVDIYSTAAGTIDIKITNSSGTELYSTGNVNVTAGGTTTPNTIPINFSVNEGTGYKILVKAYSGVNLIRGGSNLAFPYVNDNISVTASEWGGTTTGTYYFFYNIQTTSSCSTLRTPVVATVTPAPAINAEASQAAICAGESVELSVESANTDYTYEWMPGNLAGASHTLTPAETTTYTVTATDAVSGCVTSQEVVVTVNALPGEVTISPAAPEVCEGGTEMLEVEGAVAEGDAVLGTGTSAPSATSHPNPFNAWYGGHKTQMMFKASELEAQGMVPGATINSLSFDFEASVASACNDLKIRIGNTTNTDMAGGFAPVATLTTVYSASFTPTAGTTGLVAFDLTTPYVWDGSDIIVEVIHNQGNAGNGAGTRTRATTTDFVSVYYHTRDGMTPAGVGTYDAIALAGTLAEGTHAIGSSSSRPNVVFSYVLENEVTWSPMTNLYTDAAATIAYNGEDTAVVYVKPTGPATYTVTVTNEAGCSITETVDVTVNVTPAPDADATQTLCGGSSVADLEAEGDDINWYISAMGGTSLAGDTPLIDGFTYYASQTIDGCEGMARTAVTVEVNTTAPPTVSADAQIFCNEATVADLEATGTDIQWYATATGGTPLAPEAELEEDVTIYYASQTVDGCESSVRAAVAAMVNVVGAPMADADQTFCNEATVGDLMATGSGIQWYSAATGGTPLAGDTALADGTMYYASQTAGDCESATRTMVTAHITITAAPTTDDSTQSFCGVATVANLDADGDNIQWYAAATGGTPLAQSAVLIDGSIYYASQTANGCESAGRLAVTAEVDVTSAPTVDADTQVLCNAATVADLEANGENIQWYASAMGGVALSSDTVLANGTIYYASQTVNGCESTARAAVAVTINITAMPEATAEQAFCNAATVSELSATGSNIQWYADATGGIALTGDTALTDGMYYASQTVNGCESAVRAAVDVTVNVVDAPEGDASQEIAVFDVTEATIEDIEVTAEGTVYWYASEADIIAGNELPEGTQLESGATYYAMQMVGDCMSEEWLEVTVDVVLGREGFDMEAFRYYPNPVKDVLTLSYSSDITSVAIFNLLGQQVMVKDINAAEGRIDMSNLADGAYILNVTAGNSVKTIKVIKKQ